MRNINAGKIIPSEGCPIGPAINRIIKQTMIDLVSFPFIFMTILAIGYPCQDESQKRCKIRDRHADNHC